MNSEKYLWLNEHSRLTPILKSRSWQHLTASVVSSTILLSAFLLMLNLISSPSPAEAQGGDLFIADNFTGFAGGSLATAWGDYDNDGDLDLAVGTTIRLLYENRNGVLMPDPVWWSSAGNLYYSRSIAWVDYDSDGDLDLTGGNGCLDTVNTPEDGCIPLPNDIYRNNGDGTLTTIPIWSTPISDVTKSIAWGDYDGDGDPDLAIGNLGHNYIYRNDTVMGTDSLPQFTLAWIDPYTDDTQAIAWGDYDNDGDLDLATANGSSTKVPNGVYDPNRLYRNNCQDTNGGSPIDCQLNSDLSLAFSPVWTQTEQAGYSHSIGWGDYDGDGWLDLAFGNIQASGFTAPPRLYHNVYTTTNGQPPLVFEQNIGLGKPILNAILWGDYDNDGDLDLALANQDSPSQIFANEDDDSVTPAPSQRKFVEVWRTREAASDTTLSAAWADYDNDGDLDLSLGNNSIDRLYRNQGGTLIIAKQWNTSRLTTTRRYPSGVAWGDYDGDDTLDLAVSNSCLYTWDENRVPREEPVECYPSQIYHYDGVDTQGNPEFITSTWQTDEKGPSTHVAWADIDRNGWLDLAISYHCSIPQTNPEDCRSIRVYTNTNGILQTAASWTSPLTDNTTMIAWGDVDNDGWLDLAVANACVQVNPNCGPANRIYRNINGVLETIPSWGSAEAENTYDLAWGDYDNDGDLDLMAANTNGSTNRLYQNQNGVLSKTGVKVTSDSSVSVTWGDVDGDGDLDLATGNYNRPNRVYRNDGTDGQNETPIFTEIWASAEIVLTSASETVWVDYDNDGDLDLFIGAGRGSPLYRNDNGILTPYAIWTGERDGTIGAWGDYENDGDLDLAMGQGWVHAPDGSERDLRIYPNGLDARESAATLPRIYVRRPASTGNADFYSDPTIHEGPISFDFTLTHPYSQPVKTVIGWYSLNGGGNWQPATPTDGTQLIDFTTSPDGVSYTYTWDVLKDNFFGQSDNVVFRLEAVPAVVNRPNQIPGPFHYGSTSSTTYPFRVRGTQIRVMQGSQPISQALVYKLPAGQSSGGCPIGPGPNGCTPEGGTSFRTDSQGYLQGRGRIELGDRLLALVPADWTEAMTWAEGLTDTIRLYYTNDTTMDGIPEFSVTEAGVQTLEVKETNPLVLFDVDVSLEWDASTDPEKLYLGQLRSDLEETSEFIYDFTNGQTALGRVNVYQNAEDWSFAEVVVQSTNRMRPFAIQGGVVISPTLDPDHNDITYDIGQIRMGSTWNRYGNPGESNGYDWPLTLAHELAHFLFFLDDTYLGLNDDGLLIAVDSCVGSVMGDMYDPSGQNTEFLGEGQWYGLPQGPPKCEETLAHRSIDRSEWETIKLWYPFLLYDTVNSAYSGPNQQPFDFTEVTIFDPLLPTQALEDPTFFLEYEGGGSSSSNGRAFLIKDDKFVFDLGSPISGQDRVLARGAEPGDELCVFDQQRLHYGCEIVSATDEQIFMKKDEAWTPLMQVSPINSATLKVSVSNLPTLTDSLQARLFPEFGQGSETMTLTGGNGVLSGTFVFTYPVPFGHVRLWSGEREAIVGYSIGGNLGNGPHSRGSGPHSRGSGPHSRGSGPHSRGSGPHSRGSGAPIVSPDGQMIFFTDETKELREGEMYAVQSTASVPPLPTGKQLVGLSYSLVTSPNVTETIAGSVSFQYLGIDTLRAGITEDGEEELTIHYWQSEEQGWRALETIRNPYYNLASARGQGPGIYALLAGVSPPLITTFTPTIVTNNVSSTLIITGQNFLAPVQINLIGQSAIYTLSGQVVYSTTISALLPVGLPAQAYQIAVINGDQSKALASGVLSIFEPNDTACFYDYFESGANKWQRDGEWAIVTLKDGLNQAMTDSPSHPYLSAPNPPLTHTFAMTSTPFSLQTCPSPTLTFNHGYDILNFNEDWGNSQDLGRVEISTSDDGGVTWSDWLELRQYYNSAGTIQTQDSLEWSSTDLHQETILLNVNSSLARLRFSLEADTNVSGKGWVIDDVIVTSGEPAPPQTIHTFLPIVLKE